MSLQSCPLCDSHSVEFYHEDIRRPYLICDRCRLVFVPEPYHLTEAQEKAEYDLHQNNPSDLGYRQFLRRVADPLLTRLEPSSYGLDFGCGPGPTLHQLIEEGGHSVALYDKFYARDEEVLGRKYDFITATEVVEHLRAPGKVLTELWALLEPKGWLALMTKRVTTTEAFSRWHYKNDPSHIAFFSDHSFRWLAETWNTSCEFIDKDVVIFRKLPATRP